MIYEDVRGITDVREINFNILVKLILFYKTNIIYVLMHIYDIYIRIYFNIKLLYV